MTHQDITNHSPPAREALMVDPETILQVRARTTLKWGTKRIAQELQLARKTVRRYQRLSVHAEALQHRPKARPLDNATQQEAVRLFGSEAEGKPVVIQRLLASQGTQVSLRTIQ